MDALAYDENIALRLLGRLRQHFDVRRVVCFGSRSCGEGTNECDWDLLVVAGAPLDKWRRIYLARSDRRIGVPLDIFVGTPADFALARTTCGSMGLCPRVRRSGVAWLTLSTAAWQKALSRAIWQAVAA